MNALRISIVILLWISLVPCWSLVDAQEGMEWAFGPRVGELKQSITYESKLYLEQECVDQDAEFSWQEHRGRFFHPLSQGATHEWAIRAGFKMLDITTHAILPQAQRDFPNELYDLQVGTSARWRLRNSFILGGNLAIGSPSDKPFSSMDETSLQGDAWCRIPWRNSMSFILLLNYSNNREFAPHVPIPGLAFAYEPGPHLQMLAGIPYASIHWSPNEDLQFSASYFLVRRVRSQVAYRIWKTLWLFAGFDWDSQRFFRHDRYDADDRLSYYEKRLSGGFRFRMAKHFTLGLGGGYAFDRFWFEGESYDDRNRNRIELEDGPFALLQVSGRF